MILLGDRLMPVLGYPQMPPFWNQITQRRAGFCFGLWFVGGMFAQNLASTGAFEIFYDGKQVDLKNFDHAA